MRNRSRRERGFTLVELVIIVAVLGILAAVAVPVVFDFMTPAKQSATKAALAATREGVNAYYLKQMTDTGTGAYPSLAQITAKGTVLQLGIADNPYSNLADKATADDADAGGKSLGDVKAAGSAAAGWYYKPSTGQFWAATDSGAGEAGW